MTAAERARESAGLTLERAAALARVSPRYLRAIERNSSAPFVLACRLANLYQSSLDIFLFDALGGGTLKGTAGRCRDHRQSKRTQAKTAQPPRRSSRCTPSIPRRWNGASREVIDEQYYDETQKINRP